MTLRIHAFWNLKLVLIVESCKLSFEFRQVSWSVECDEVKLRDHRYIIPDFHLPPHELAFQQVAAGINGLLPVLNSVDVHEDYASVLESSIRWAVHLKNVDLVVMNIIFSSSLIVPALSTFDRECVQMITDQALDLSVLKFVISVAVTSFSDDI